MGSRRKMGRSWPIAAEQAAAHASSEKKNEGQVVGVGSYAAVALAGERVGHGPES
jgi:hypothetical protein